MSPAKVTLSPKELELATNTDWILTKNRIIQKVYELFGELAGRYREDFNEISLEDKNEILFRSAKIAKGEQYENLPWVMLDYPRYYQAEDSFGIRTFFWWGNHFSIHLQLSGKYCTRYRNCIRQYFQKINTDTEDWWIGIGNDPWEHHFRENNFQPIAANLKLLEQVPFIKIARNFPIHEWENIPQLMEASFRKILMMLSYSDKDQALPSL